MKKRFIHLMALMASFVLLTNCDKDPQLAAGEDNIPDQEILAPAEPMTFNFVADYPDLNVPMRSEVAVDGKVSWSQEDVVTLYYIENGIPTSTTATVVTVNAENAARAEFSATIPSSVEEVWAAFPAGTGAIDEQGVFSMNVSGPFDGSFTSANISAAHASVSEGALLKFKNVIGIFRVELPQGSVISNGDKNYTIGSIMIDSKLGEPAFGGKVTVTADGENNLTFSEPVETSDQVVAQLTEATRGQSYAYLPALPVSCEDGLAVRFVDKDGAAIPAAVTVDGKDVELQRSHIMPVNKAYEGIVWNWYFTPDGTGDGKTESNPADVTTLQDMLNGTDADYCQWRLNGAVLNLAAGEYKLTEPLNIKGRESGDIVVKGAGKEQTVIDGSILATNSTKMFAYESAMNLVLQNLSIMNGISTGGGAISNEGATGELNLYSCRISKNESKGAGGAMYLKGGAVNVENCDFIENRSKTYGGAIHVSSSEAPSITFNGCTFVSNNAGGEDGGAIYHGSDANMYIDNTLFKDNACAKKGGAVYLAKAKLFVNRTAFDNNSTASDNGNYGAGIYSNGLSCFYNCTFHFNHGTGSKGSTSVSMSNYILANCTFKESVAISNGVFYSAADADSKAILVNNVVLNNKSYSALYGNNNNYATSGYNLTTLASGSFTKVKEDQTTYIPSDGTGRNALGNVFNNLDESFRYYAWDGDVSRFSGYNKCNLAKVEELIKKHASGSEFWKWLSGISVNGVPSTNVDIRGVERSTDQMWPGSYQQDN